MDENESFASACSSEQVGSCKLVPKTKTKPSESLRIIDQSEASLLDDTLDLDSKVSAGFRQAEQFPTSTTNTGARQKTSGNLQLHKQENFNQHLRMPTRIPSPVASNNVSNRVELKTQENDNRKLKIPIKTSSPKKSNKNNMTAISLRKTNGSSKTN